MRVRSEAELFGINLHLNVRGLEPSATIAINERSNELRHAGRDVIKLGLGQSPFPIPPSVVRALQENAHQKDYLPARGLPALREAVAAYHRRAQGIEAESEGVLVGPGSKELMFLLQLVHSGDLVLPSPSWVSYAPQARILGRQVHWIPTSGKGDWKMGAGQLDAFCSAAPHRPRILVINYPSNPTGATYDESELRAIAAVARRHRLIVLADEIYGETHHLLSPALTMVPSG